MTGFTYHRPATLEEAFEAIGRPGAIALAGGTDIVPLRSSGAIAPRHLVDVKRVRELGGIEVADGRVSIGATTTFDALGARAEPELAAIADGARIVGAAQTRARATIGGNVCRSSPAGDTLCGLLVVGADAELRGPRGTRRVPLADFFVGPGRNVREPDELLTRVIVDDAYGGSAYARFTYRRTMDLAVVGVGAHLVMRAGTCVAASVAIGAVRPTPALVPEAGAALVGTPVDADAVAAACQAVVSAASPIDDVRGTRRHRLRVLSPLARDVIRRAAERAIDKGPR